MIIATYHNDPEAFSNAALPFLMKSEVENNLIIGLALRLQSMVSSLQNRQLLFWVIRDGEEVIGAAMCTPPNDLLLSYPFNNPALSALSEFLRSEKVSLPGTLGLNDIAQQFSEMWKAANGIESNLWRRERAFKLDKVNPLPVPPGYLVQGSAEYSSTLLSFIEGFIQDTGEQGDPQSTLKRGLDNDTLFVWYDGKPVSMAVSTRPTPNTISITLVYTPPELRRKGYATATVSALSEKLLKQGYTYCSLYTDLSNPTSNSIYQKIGYRPVLDCFHYRFRKK